MSSINNIHRYSGAIKELFPVTSRTYKDKEGNEKIAKERVIIIRNKQVKWKRYIINDAMFSVEGKFAEDLELMTP